MGQAVGTGRPWPQGAWKRHGRGGGILCRGEAFADAGGSWGSSGGLAQCFTRNVARALVGPYSSLMSSLSCFPSSSLLPSAGMGGSPFRPMRAFPRQVLQTPVTFTDIPARNSRTNTSLVQMLLTFSHCFWKGKRSLCFAAQTVAEGP